MQKVPASIHGISTLKILEVVDVKDLCLWSGEKLPL